MSEPSKTRAAPPTKEERLAAALRENLKRRKAQARAQQDIKQGDPKKAGKNERPLR